MVSRVVSILIVLVLGCAGAESSLGPQPGPFGAPGPVATATLVKATDFRGTCSWGRPPGQAGRYRVPLRVRPSPAGSVLVRSSAHFDLTDDSNILGELPSGAEISGDGPVYDEQTDSRGYAILVRGYAGRVCRGYVSDSSVLTHR